jgi:hypothetical protein
MSAAQQCIALNHTVARPADLQVACNKKPNGLCFFDLTTDPPMCRPASAGREGPEFSGKIPHGLVPTGSIPDLSPLLS